jgi:hypothetical protein
MRRLAPRLLAVIAAPFLASCVFLLDYDDLQGGSVPNDGGTTATAGAAAGGMADSVGGVGASGEAGSSSSCGDCNDHDACTVDTCDETGDAPTCTHEATEGLKLDGFETTLTSLRHVRVSVVAGGQQFYFATLEGEAAGPKVSLYRLASDGTELESFGADLALEGVPMSNVGLAVEELAVGEIALHGFVATKLKVAAAVPRVFHVVNRGDKTMVNVAGLSYAGNETVFPQALVMGDKVVGAWIQADGTIAVHNVGSAKTDTFGLPTLPATTLALLSTGDAQPAIMFTAEAGPKQALGTYVETSGQNRTKLPECEARPGDYLSSSVIGTQIPGLWLANITRFGDEYLTTGGGTLVCGNNVCVAAGEDCAQATPSNGVRNIAGATVRFEADPPGIIYSVLAIPQVAPKLDDATSAEGKLSLALGRADFSEQKPTSTKIGGDPETGLMTVARNDTDEAAGFAGPDWPAVAILPTKQVAVAWIQPNPSADGTELHVRRYKMCLGEP